MATKPLVYKDKNGYLKIQRQGNILVAEFDGACSVNMAKKFIEFCEIIGEGFDGRPGAT